MIEKNLQCRVGEAGKWKLIEHRPLSEDNKVVTVSVGCNVGFNHGNVRNRDEDAPILVQEHLCKFEESFNVLLTILIPGWNIVCVSGNILDHQTCLHITNDQIKPTVNTVAGARIFTILSLHLQHQNEKFHTSE